MSILPPKLLETIRARADKHDRENSFPHDDLRDLAELGYLRMLVPRSFGGLGMSLPEATREQARLAGAAPATALAVNMHLVWTGVARLLHERGDTTLDFVLREAAEGEIFGFGISEPGNDLVLFGSMTTAEPSADGGYRFTGTKVFTSLSPVWTRLGIFGRDDSGAEPQLVHAFVERGCEGVEILDDWDTIGMRASQSNTTRLVGAYAPADRVFGQRPLGPSAHPLVFAIFANFLLLLASVYAGIAQRALELGVEAAKSRRSQRTGLTADQSPDTRWKLADAALALDGFMPQLEAVARDVDEGTDHGDQWFRALTGVRLRATETAKFVVEQAVRVSGGRSYRNGDELGRLLRDVLAGAFHPSNEDAVHSTVATALLGPLEQNSTGEDD
ncbi:acyl-CoA dehydrogenase [Salinibacterium sp. dk2585]|uniref:acyl-CoA dehydrogenase family protein n=1 Tax=unclassified Salinibacterium TaxID=2632331 RepID=UPI0011C24310|nr:MULTISPECIES: acyl-CoA dehydrogenase family protein [unclassified Salinibacterium]QEE61691.1 acyl-CoA dehydrogenase [Salinibacterium sp. dk2585]TXK54757.1 acyl-CoA dehydrogenase [Salinibacterium sp. dk5596]